MSRYTCDRCGEGMDFLNCDCGGLAAGWVNGDEIRASELLVEVRGAMRKWEEYFYPDEGPKDDADKHLLFNEWTEAFEVAKKRVDAWLAKRK